MLTGDAMREVEPNVGGIAGLRVPEEGIVDYAAVCAAMVREIVEGGGKVATSARVTGLRRMASGWGGGDAGGGRFRRGPGGELRRAALRPGERADGAAARAADCAVPRGVLQDSRGQAGIGA